MQNSCMRFLRAKTQTEPRYNVLLRENCAYLVYLYAVLSPETLFFGPSSGEGEATNPERTSARRFEITNYELSVQECRIWYDARNPRNH
jgi:hypothetical protein